MACAATPRRCTGGAKARALRSDSASAAACAAGDDAARTAARVRERGSAACAVRAGGEHATRGGARRRLSHARPDVLRCTAACCGDGGGADSALRAGGASAGTTGVCGAGRVVVTKVASAG